MRGYKEEGTTTTPFDMVMLNDLDRFHLVIDVIDRVPGLAARAAHLRQEMVDRRLEARAWTREHGEDDPDDPRLDLAVLSRPRRQRGLDEPEAAPRRRATIARRRSTTSCRPTPSATGSSTAARASSSRR